MLIEFYRSQTELIFRNYVSANLFLVFTSVIIGIFACKTVYDVSQLISAIYFKNYLNLTKSRQIEWNNRAMSTFHAVYITPVSLYFVFRSDVFIGNLNRGPITLQSSTFSTCALGASVGYFIADLGMIIWRYPSLGGMEYGNSSSFLFGGCELRYADGGGSILHIRGVNIRGNDPLDKFQMYLDAAGMKRSGAYIVNGIVIFLSWLVVRILLFIYMFCHVYLYYDQVKQVHTMGVVLVFFVPFVLSVMNLMWFCKIFKGLKKTLSKRE
ncbi:hypothetical protein OROHE_022245 [Orobanche hederae]